MTDLQGRKTGLLIRMLATVILSLFGIVDASSQEKENYVLGESGRLEMIVHIIGEVKKPGEYRVVDGTNLMELISKAEGPTEFSNLKGVTITRSNPTQMANGKNGSSRTNGYSRRRGKRIIKYNVNDYLKRGMGEPPPLRPGDIVLIPRNSWRKWRNAFTIVRDLSVVASVYFLYLRATRG